ncbi:uncharacterized protein TRUGW13939_10777 [Talaromyces rugulosus]|uniref:C3H1-type domain-containing protein n=1 Tax=Talaromyces rugulosus TaxID=121627 RepID=A0A7H8RBB5_TALRU|nr:uncharacterized protein TRUGW13939_10777 [Talaromyces rugulosus]QKX63606.1 hypothetical protein TRUGW13939_10777 [Talaromyces rugulosus]
MPELRPQFFLGRDDGSIVPLIALDELPPHVSIRGVPRNMSLGEAEDMKNLGQIPWYGVYHVDLVKDRVGITTHPTNDTVAAITPYNGGSKGKSRLSEKKVNGSPSKQIKVYCTYWIRHGECDFAQQGCRFRHVMPTDLPTLQSIGFSDIPSWYREKGGLESLRSGPSSTGLPKGNWRKPSTPPKTIAYHDEDTLGNGNPLGPTEKPGDKALDHHDNARPSPELIGRASGFENTAGYPYIQDTFLVSPASTPSMSHTVDSLSPRSSLGGHNLWSPTDQKVKGRHTVASGGQACEKMVDDSEPEYRSITELLPYSVPEDRFGNITTERSTPERAMAYWCWGPCF